LKICMIFNASASGLGTHPGELVKNLSELGHKIHLIIPETKVLPHSDNIKPHFTKIIKYSYPSILKIPLQAVVSAIYSLRISRKEGVKLVYTRSPHFALALIPFIKLNRIKLVFEINGLYADELAVEKRRGRFIRRPVEFLETFATKRATAIVAVTQGIKNELIRKGIDGRKIQVIENGANIEMFSSIGGTVISELRSKLGIRNDDQVVIFVGQLYAWQGVEHFIESMSLVLEQCSNTQFLIVGDGQVKEVLVELAEQVGVSASVIFTGMVPYQEVPLYINAGDVCVVPKKLLKGGYSPLKLYEYMACEKPVVATRTSGFELLEENNAGLLVNPENSQEFAQAIIKLLQNPELRKRMGENGRRYVVENRTWESVARKVAEVCESAIQEHKNKGRRQ